MYPDHYVGFDVVGTEDYGNSFLFHHSSLLGLQLPLFLHTAETNWPGDLITSKNIPGVDPAAAAGNGYDAILLGSKRIGHGLGFIKQPYLLQMVKDRKIVIESCPIRFVKLFYGYYCMLTLYL